LITSLAGALPTNPRERAAGDGGPKDKRALPPAAQRALALGALNNSTQGKPRVKMGVVHIPTAPAAVSGFLRSQTSEKEAVGAVEL
jgi:hypothetical protein